MKTITERREERPVIHKLKCWPQFYSQVIAGQKPFELRPADRDFREGDLLCLQEFRQSGMYTGRKVFCKIGYILKGKWGGLADGWVIMGIRPHPGPGSLPVLKAPAAADKPDPKTPSTPELVETVKQAMIQGLEGGTASA